jgi:CubicO group peptidase (beta-lactamase class C family)
MNAKQNFPTKNELEKLMEEKKIPGLSLVIIEKGEIALHFELGLKNSKNKEPIDIDTLFEAASLSKPVFVYGILQLIEDKKLDLDKPLIEYLLYPDIKNDKRLELITTRMVLTHTTGFPNWRPKNEGLKIHFDPGERFSYSGEGYLYLQKVIERITGSSLEEYMKKNVFIPLGMSHSTFIWINDDKKAFGHDLDGNPIKHRDEKPNSAFTLHTNALDYAKFVIAILEGKGLKPETINVMLRPHVKVQAECIESIDQCSGNLSDSISWSLGWGIQHTQLGDSFWHWGDNKGVKCFVIGTKKLNKAMIVFTNSSNGLSLISEVANKYWGAPQPVFEWLQNDGTKGT